MITLDITSSEVRILETDGNTINSWASHAIKPDIFEDGMIAKSDALGQIIKELMNSSGIKGSRVTAGINGLFSLSRIIIVPTPPEIPVAEQAVLEAVENTLPISLDETYLSWNSIGVGEGGHQVMIHAVPKEMIDDEMSALKTAGINARVLDLRTMALARTINTEEGLIFNIDSETFDIVMIVDGLAEVMRTAAWQQEGLSIEEKAELLTTAIETTVSFYDNTRPNFPFRKTNPLYITGEMSGNLELVQLIRDKLEFSEAKLEPPLEYPEHFPVSQYAVNIGLALKGMIPDNEDSGSHITPDINMMPRAYQPWRPTPKQMYLSLAIFVALALLVPLYQVTAAAMNETENLEKQYASINNLMELRKTALAKRDPLKQAVTDYDTLKNMGKSFMEDYETIRNLTQKYSAKVGSISHQGNSISFTCETENYQIFRQFMTALEESGRFLTPITPPEGYPYIKSGIIKLRPNTGES